MKILKVNPSHPDGKKIKYAAEAAGAGKLVVFPTETVYGLGADMHNRQAVERVYGIKGRPVRIPLTVHVPPGFDIRLLARNIPGAAYGLISRFWPGPLTLVLRKKKIVPHFITGGSETVGIRAPSHPVSVRLLKACRNPLVAPSANRYGHISPTSPAHIEKNIGDMLLDSGRTKLGIESTVLDMTSSPPRILRPGNIPAEDIMEVTGRVLEKLPGHRLPAPAGKNSTPLRIGRSVSDMEKLARKGLASGTRTGLIVSRGNLDYFRAKFKKHGKIDIISYGRKGNLAEIAERIYPCLHALNGKTGLIIIEAVSMKGVGASIMHRLEKFGGKNG